MPIYEMKCSKCEKVTEYICKYEDRPKECRDCKGELVQQVSNTSFQLNGTGWFKDGYKGKK